jgi:hypothetical protein
MIEENCENCKFYKHENGMDEDVGRCKRFPPVYVFETLDLNSEGDEHLHSFAWAQPSVAFDNWCGEWKEKA